MEPLTPGERTARICAIIPVLDEEGSIGPVVSAMPCQWVDEVLVVDGGSRDRTAEVARRAGATVLIERQPGYGRACAAGASEATAKGSAILVFLDGDGGDAPDMISVLVHPILDGTHDFVIGSRMRGMRERGSMGAHQMLAGRAIGLAIHLLYGVRYTDMCAFRAIRADALARLGMREMTYGWNLEMQMQAARMGLRILEVPVPHGRRTAGRSKVAGTVRGTLKATTRILLTFCRVACARGRTRADRQSIAA